MYMQFGGKPVLRLLQRMRATGKLYEKQLRKYPDVRCEPLDFFYQCRRGMDALDANLFCDLMDCYSWREANWAVWLAALVPKSYWIDHLRQKKSQLLPHATLAIDLALIAAGERVSGVMPEHVDALSEVRSMLQELPATPYKMRLNMSSAQELCFDAEVTALRIKYRDGGLASARPLLRQGLLGYYRMTRSEWLLSGGVGAPNSPTDGPACGKSSAE